MQTRPIKILLLVFSIILLKQQSTAQLQWTNVDSMFQPLPASVHVYKTTSLLDGKPNIAYYLEADLKDQSLDFTIDTSHNRRLTPAQFYTKGNQPLLVVNTTFFSFSTNQSLNLVIKDGKILTPNPASIPLKGKDTLKYFHTLSSAIGIGKNGTADIAWLMTGKSRKKVWASPNPVHWTDSSAAMSPDSVHKYSKMVIGHVGEESTLFRWRMKAAAGGGPVLMADGEINITNNEERKFAGKAIEDKHPRTAIGYTRNNKLIILVIQGRFPGLAEGATLKQEAGIFKDLGCWEAINLDGGGSSCMLINGKETIKPSDKEGQRAVPAVLIIRRK